MKPTKIITFVCFAISIYLGYYLYGGIRDTIDTRESIGIKEAAVIEKLKFIREAEKLFQGFHGKYTSNWDSLIQFIDDGKLPIVERREEIIQKPYGGEDVIVHIDTLGFISVREQLFKQKFTMNASTDGEFLGFLIKVGDKALKNQRAYSIKVGKKVVSPPFSEEGTISTLARVQPGDSVTKGMLLINFWDYHFDPNMDIKRIAYTPNTDIQFDIFTGVVEKNGLPIAVIEVKDPDPVNPDRSEDNEINSFKPLRFGSRVDATTSGNWE